MNRAVALTGGTGFLGNVIARKLIADNTTLHVLVRSADKLGDIGLHPAKVAVGNILDVDSLIDCFAGCDAVVHAAALISVHAGNRSELERVNVDGTANVIEACRRAGVRRLIAVGSIEAFDLAGGGDISTRKLDTDHSILPYGRTKSIAASLVLEANGDDLETAVISPTALIGPYDFGPSPMGRFVRTFLSRSLPASVPGGFYFLDVRDAASACVQAIARGEPGRHYIVSGPYLSVDELIELLSDSSGVPAPRIKVPRFLALAFAHVNVVVCDALGRSTLIAPEAVRILATEFELSCDPAISDLGFSARTMRETIADTVRWFRNSDFEH